MRYLKEFTSYNLIQEAFLVIKKDLDNVLSVMDSEISNHLLSLKMKDTDLAFNLFGLGNDMNTLSFVNANKLKFKITDGNYIFSPKEGYDKDQCNALSKVAGLKKYKKKHKGIKEGDIGDIGKIYNMNELNALGIWGIKEIGMFTNKDGVKGFVIMDRGVEMVIESKPNNARIGRVVRKTLNDAGIEYNDTDVEGFVNEFKSKMSLISNSNLRFEVVKGDQIKHFYHNYQYDKTKHGTLQSSCMRYTKCQKYLDVYSKNPQVRLLILKSIKYPEKITGRALLWELQDGDTFMDRVYYSEEHEKDIFIDHAIENGWWFKHSQNSSAGEEILNKRGGLELKEVLKVKLDSGMFRYYPYTDTLKYINTETGEMSNDDSEIEPNGDLESTYGGLNSDDECDICDGEERVDCDTCDGFGEENCDTCDGDGTVTCRWCKDGEVDCSQCDGDGKIEVDCHKCEGSEAVECPDCQGSGESDDGEKAGCYECNGTGTITCDACDGDGTELIECDECYGSGERNCDECDGEGEIECSDCYGDGEIECGDCDGDGRVDCPECC